jgi:hypothetical protein
MLFSSWLRNRQRSAPLSARRSPLAFRRRASFHPRLEILEDRNMLSTYVVSSLTDTGMGSGLAGDLRYCITNATSGNDMITFAANLTGTIKLESALPALNASVAIQGPGVAALTVENDPLDTTSFDIFAVASTATVEISGLNISAIDSPFVNVGDIANAGTLTVRDSNLNGSITNSGTATLLGSAWTSVQVAPSYNSGPRSAGPIDNTGTMTISGSILYGPGSFIGTAAIANSGVLTLNYSTIKGISAFAPNGNDAHGGAIFNQGSLTVNNSTLTNNDVQGGMGTFSGGPGWYARPGIGAGIYMSAGTLSINDSTLSDNRALGGNGTTSYGAYGGHAGSGYGGGLYIAGGTVSINNSTFDNNQAVNGVNTDNLGYPGDASGGGIDNAAGPGALQMYDTILADNSASTAAPDLAGSVASLGYNLIGISSGGNGFVASDLLNVNPLLGPLQNNGGPTETMALLPGSPAIDAGDNANAPAYDQRGPGYPRIAGGFIDIGAFEVQNNSTTQASSLAVSGFPSIVTAGSAGSFKVTALNADGTTDTGYTGTVRFSSSDVQADLPADYAFTAADSGVHTFSATLKTAGTQSLTVTDLIFGTTGTETGIAVTPATGSRLAIGQQPTTTTAGQTVSPTVTVAVEDPYGNVVTADNSTVTLMLSSGTFVNESATVSATASGGVATFSALKIDAAGSYTLKATDGSLTSATSGSFTITPATASTLSVTGFPSSTAGVAHNVTVTLKDAYGNIATGYIGTVHFTSSDAQAGLPANYTFTAADAGAHTFSVMLKTAGTQLLTVTDTAKTSLSGTESGITVRPAAASKFVLAAAAVVNPGVPFSLTITVEDAYGNVVVGYTGTIHFSSTDTRATLPANYTFTVTDKGVHAFTGLVLHKKGNQKITVTDTHDSALTGTDIINVV